MLKDDLKCVLIGRNIDIYNDLARLVKKIDATSRFKQVDVSKTAIIETLKSINGPSLIFISDEVSFSLELLSDLIWQHHTDAIVVIISTKARTVPIKELFNNTQFSRIKLRKNNPEITSILQLLIKSARERSEFRRCKNLLGVSEKRCQWLVDSSKEAVAFISRDMHWYANIAYLNLFGIESVQSLRSITVKDLIISDEHLLFDSFKSNQKKSTKSKQSILLSMKKSNGSTFRANAYLIPSIFKGHKCYQIWVREVNAIDSIEDTEELKKPDGIQSDPESQSLFNSGSKSSNFEDENPFGSLIENTEEPSRFDIESIDAAQKSTDSKEIFEKDSRKTVKQKSHDVDSLLKGIIRRKEARIVAKPLSSLKQSKAKNIITHQLLSLRVASAQKKGVDDLLIKSPGYFKDDKRSVFWEKVKFSRLLQILIQREDLKINLFLRVHEASITDQSFIDWLVPGLKRLGNKSSRLTFLIPSNIDDAEHRKVLLFVKKLRSCNCKIALDSFSTNKQALVLLKHSTPDYVRLSLPWVRQLQGNDAKEIRLSSVIRRLEENDIQVIAPCGFSRDMRRLFILSGASFCQ